MRKICVLLFILAIMFQMLPVFATGDGNMDGGGGGMGSGTGDSYWSPGADGVRVTIINSNDNKAISGSVDFTNITPKSKIIHFGKYSKLSYREGKQIIPQVGNYTCSNTIVSMPKIVASNSGGNDIAVIKRYFCSERIIMMIAEKLNFQYDILVNGNYKLLIEPVAYFTYQGNYFAMTATEAALYDRQVSGRLRAKMVSLTHKNLPFAIFLERPDLGFPAWTGATTNKVSNDTIISTLGLGIVKFTEDGGDGPQTNLYDYTYRTDTDVITSIMVNTNTEYNPDKPLSVRFTVNNKSYTVNNIVIPQDESQVVWFKWHTPTEPQEITIRAKVGGRTNIITANIVKLEESEPPDPKANDRNDKFTKPSLPASGQTASLSWGVWSAAWYEYWEWVADWQWNGHRWIDHGEWIDNGWWEYEWNDYTASIDGTLRIAPDSRVPTALGTQIKSGYGFQANVNARISGNAPASAYTQLQTAVAYFPEFKYQNYWRILDKTVLGNRSNFQFAQNKYSTYQCRAHYTAIWYPDGSYTPYVQVYDAWTPAGMLTLNLTHSITISGNLFSDWHAAPKK